MRKRTFLEYRKLWKVWKLSERHHKLSELLQVSEEIWRKENFIHFRVSVRFIMSAVATSLLMKNSKYAIRASYPVGKETFSFHSVKIFHMKNLKKAYEHINQAEENVSKKSFACVLIFTSETLCSRFKTKFFLAWKLFLSVVLFHTKVQRKDCLMFEYLLRPTSSMNCFPNFPNTKKELEKSRKTVKVPRSLSLALMYE